MIKMSLFLTTKQKSELFFVMNELNKLIKTIDDIKPEMKDKLTEKKYRGSFIFFFVPL